MAPPEGSESAGYKELQSRAAMPGKGGLARIGAALRHTIGGFREGLLTEAAIKQEVAILIVAVPVSFVIAETVWVWAALIGSLILLLALEFLNTAIERLCNHLHPDKHEAIKITKDLASAGVFCVIALAALIWIAAVIARYWA